MNQNSLDEKLNLQNKTLEKYQIFSTSHKNFKGGINNILKKISGVSLSLLLVFSITTQIIITKTDFNVNTYAQEIIQISDITTELSDTNGKIEQVEVLSAEFNDRQINYFDDETKVDTLSVQKDILSSYKESLKTKIIEKEEENRRIEEERIALEEENRRIEEEARLKREAEAQRQAELKAQSAIASSTSSTVQSSSSSTTTSSSDTSGTKFDWMDRAGIAKSDQQYVDYIITKESGWRHLVWNTSGSSAYGLCQSLPATKMASAGADYMTNPITQLKWCDGYAQQRYGGWANAYSFWTVNNWW